MKLEWNRGMWVCGKHTAFPMWDQHRSHMIATSFVCWYWYCIRNAVPLSHTHIPQFHSNLCRKRNLQLGTYVDTVNATVMLASWWDPMSTFVIRGCRSALTLAFQYSRSHAYVHNSRQEFVDGASINMSPCCGALNISNMACFTFLSVPILNICPSHCSFLTLTYPL